MCCQLFFSRKIAACDWVGRGPAGLWPVRGEERIEMARRKQVGLGWEEKGPVVGAPGPSGLLRRVRPRWPGVQGGFYLLNESSEHPRGVATEREKKNPSNVPRKWQRDTYLFMFYNTLFYKIKNL